MVSLLEAPMAKSTRGGARPGAGRPKTGTDYVAVKLDRAVVAKARLIAAHRGQGVTTADVLSELLATPIDKAYAQMIRELNAK